MIVKYVDDNQLYIFINGKFVYKKWLLTGQSFVFDLIPYSKWDTLVSYELRIKKNVNFREK
jgi:hypothetical protein